MANIRYRKDRKRWEVRRSVKDPFSGVTRCLCRLLPPKSTQQDARKVADEFDLQARRIRYSRFPSLVSVPVAVETYLTMWKTHSTESYCLYTFTLEKFTKSLPANIEYLSEITPQHVQCFIAGIIQAGNKPRTANARLTVIKSFCKWCSKIYSIQNPASAIDFLPERPPERRTLNDEEMAAILGAVTPDIRDRLIFLANTGLRASELCGLTWGGIASDMGSLSITGKGWKVRAVPLNAVCREILDRLKPADGAAAAMNRFVFESQSTAPLPDNRLTRSGLFNTCKKIADRLGIRSFGPHSFRHYFATKLIVSGTPMAIVSKILGHASTETTERVYTHILPANLFGATDLLGGLAVFKTRPESPGT